MDTRPGLLGVPYCCARSLLAMPLRPSDCTRFLRELPSEADLHIDPPPMFHLKVYGGAVHRVNRCCMHTLQHMAQLTSAPLLSAPTIASTPAMRLSADLSVADNSPAHVLGTCH